MKRLLTAAVMIPVVLAAVFGGNPWLLLAVIAVFASLSFLEYCQILQIDSHTRTLGLLAGAGLLVMPNERVFLAMVLFSLVAVALPLRADDLHRAFLGSAAMFLGVLYLFGSMKTAYLLGIRSPWWLLFPLVLNWIGDSGAYYVGRAIGKHKLAPRISPGKTWEGAIASAVFSVVFVSFLMPLVLPVPREMAALLALAGNIAGQLGDLAESALKRGVGVKDSGTILPGHGGMLDRVDSTFFTLPVFYALMLWFRL